MIITTLAPNEVFVFGANASGFHGEGAAGIAMRGIRAVRTSPHYLPWRDDAQFRQAMNSPVGSDARIGEWAVFGQSTGFQIGRSGMSYGVCTISRPGQRRSVSRREIYFQLVELWRFAAQRADLRFLMSAIGTGYSGYSDTEMREVFEYLISKYGQPANVVWLPRHEGLQFS